VWQISFSCESNEVVVLFGASGFTMFAVAFGTLAATLGCADIVDPTVTAPKAQAATSAAPTTAQATR
jgi:ABC-type taurine transport system ATPase subunit